MKPRAEASEIFLYGYIGWECKASDFLNSLRDKEEKFKDITIRINSVGGDVFEGLPMYNNLRQCKSKTTAIIDGLAASMATVVMCGCAKVKAVSNALIMVHGPTGGDFTSIENLEVIVETMKKMRADIAKVYALKTGKTEEWIMENWLVDGKDHWFTAEEAKQAGLVDEVIQADGSAAELSWGRTRIAAFYNENFLLNNKPELTMKKTIAALNATGLVVLTESATDELVESAVRAITAQLSAKDQDITRLTAEKKAAEDKVTEALTNSLKKNAVTMIESALAAKKIVAGEKDHLIALASASEESYKAMEESLKLRKGYESVADKVIPPGDETDADRVKLYDKLHKEGGLAQLKASNPDRFNQLMTSFKASKKA